MSHLSVSCRAKKNLRSQAWKLLRRQSIEGMFSFTLVSFSIMKGDSHLDNSEASSGRNTKITY
jgi:hypothetical protein